MAKQRERRRYTDAQKQRIVTYANNHGVPEAVEKYGAHGTSIRAWREKLENGSTPSEKPRDTMHLENAALRKENQRLKDYIIETLLA